MFQSTHPRRVRRPAAVGKDLTTRFQSTHPRRVRLQHYTSHHQLNRFNPRTHVGCDES